MNNQFTQPKKVVAVETNKQAIARVFDIKASEVLYAKAGAPLQGYKAIYDPQTQHSYALPVLALGETVVSLVDGKLITSVATYDLAVLAVKRKEWNKITEDFTTGFTLTEANQVVVDGTSLYRWGGAFPKSVAAGDSVQGTGGINSNAWIVLDSTGSSNNTISLVSFGADSTGTTDTTDQIIAAFEYAANNNLNVVQNSGDFIISKIVPVSCRLVDLSGCNLLMRAGGEFQYSQKAKPVTYDSTTAQGTALLAAINSSSLGSRAEGSSKLDGLATDTTLNGKYIILKSPQQMFKYRDGDGILTRIEFNRVYSHGRLESSFKYTMPTNFLSCYALPINRFVSVLRGFNFVLSQESRYRVCLVSDSSRLHISNFSVDGVPIDGSKDFFLIEKVRCYDVVVENYDIPTTFKVVDATANTARSSYCISMGECMNVRYENVHANGDGWGSTGNNNCSRVTYNNCKLSRIDFHMPFRDYMRINNCDLGRDGIVVTGMGDLIINNSTFTPRTDTIGTTLFPGNVISTRGDAGGWFDGDLYMNNVVIRGRNDEFMNTKAIIAGNSEASDRGPVSGSPINDTLFNNIYIDGLSYAAQGLETHWPNLIACNTNDAFKFPRSISVRNFNTNYAKSSGVGLIIPFNNFAAVEGSSLGDNNSTVNNAFTTNIILDNVNATHLSIIANSFRHNPKVSARNLRNDKFAESSTTFATNQRGTYEFVSCELDNIRIVYSSTPNGPVRVKMLGGKIMAASREIISGAPSNHHIQLSNVDIVSDFNNDTSFVAAKNLAQYAVMSKCSFFDTDGTKLKGISLWKGTSLNVSPGLAIKAGNTFNLANGYTSNSTYAINGFEVPLSTSKVWAYLGGSNNAAISFTGSSNGVTTVNNVTSSTGLEAVEMYLS